MENRLFDISSSGWEIVPEGGTVSEERGALVFKLYSGMTARKNTSPKEGVYSVHLTMGFTGKLSICVGNKEVFWEKEDIPYTHIIGNVTLSPEEVFVIKALEDLELRISEALQVIPEFEDLARTFRSKLGKFYVEGFNGETIEVSPKYGPVGEELVKAKIPAITYYFFNDISMVDDMGIREVRDGVTDEKVLFYTGIPLSIGIQLDTWCWKQSQEAKLLENLTRRLSRLDYIHVWGIDFNLSLAGSRFTSDDLVPFRKTFQYTLDLVGFEQFKEISKVRELVVQTRSLG